MPSFTSSTVRPGVFVRIQDQVIPTPPSGVFIPTAIGVGFTQKLIQKSLTRGATPDGTDALLAASEIATDKLDITRGVTVTDEDGIVYRETGVAFTEGASGAVPRAFDVSLAAGVFTLTWADLAGALPATGKAYTVFYGPTDNAKQFSKTFTKGAGVNEAEVLASAAETAVNQSPAKFIIVDQFGKLYDEAADFTVNADGSGDALEVDWAPTGGTTAEPAAGVAYFVTFFSPKTAASNDYEARLFTDGRISAVEAIYGAESAQASGVNLFEGVDYTLTLGARHLLENNAGPLYALQLDPADSGATTPEGAYDPSSDTQNVGMFEAALIKTENFETRALTIMLGFDDDNATTKGLLTTLKNHVDTQSSTLIRKERVAIVGMTRNFTTPPSSQEDPFVELAALLQTNRMAVVAPSKASKVLDGESVLLDGASLAAAVTGRYVDATVDAGEPISGKDVVGFSEITSNFTRLQTNRLLASGCLPIEDPAIVQALTTDVSTVPNAELKVTRIKDFVAQTLRGSLEKIYINTRNLGIETQSNVQSSTRLLLAQMVTQTILVDFDSLDVTQDGTDPRQINIVFQILPTFDVNWIYITFGVTFPS